MKEITVLFVYSTGLLRGWLSPWPCAPPHGRVLQVSGTVEEGILALNQKRAHSRGGLTGVGKRERETLSLADICALFPEETAVFRSRSPARSQGLSLSAESGSLLAGRVPGTHPGAHPGSKEQDSQEGLRSLPPGAAAAAAAEARLQAKREIAL